MLIIIQINKLSTLNIFLKKFKIKTNKTKLNLILKMIIILFVTVWNFKIS